MSQWVKRLATQVCHPKGGKREHPPKAERENQLHQAVLHMCIVADTYPPSKHSNNELLAILNKNK